MLWYYVYFAVMLKQTLAVLAALILFSCNEKETENPPQKEESQVLMIDRVYRPLAHHFSSTGCGPCGRFGIPLISQVADEMGDSIVPLITHFKYNDPFITESSKAIEQALLFQWYSPQIWVNNTNITLEILNDGIPAAVKETKELLRTEMSKSAEAFVGLSAKLNASDRFDIEWIIENNMDDSASYYVEVYAMEDGIVASQAGADPFVSTHYKVNRGGHYGDMGLRVDLGAKASEKFEIEFVPCWVCEAEKQYFNIIVWKETSPGRFHYINGKVIP